MAISLVSPGVKITETDQISSVASLATSTGAFAGQFRWGPVNDPQLVTSEAELVSKFAAPDSNNIMGTVDFLTAANFLSYSSSLYVVRANNNANNAGTTTTVSIPNETTYYESFSNGSQSSVGAWAAKWPGELGNALLVSACASANAFQSGLTGSVAATQGVATLTGTGTAFTTEVQVGDLIAITSGGVTRSVKVKTIGSNTSITLESSWPAANVSGITGADLKRRWEFFGLFDAAPGTTTYGAAQGATNDEMHVVVVDKTGKLTGVKDNVLEKYASVSKGRDAKGENGGTNYYKDVINQQSAYVWWISHLSGVTSAGNALGSTTFGTPELPVRNTFTGGTDGSDISSANRITAYQTLADKDRYPLAFVIGGQADVAVDNVIISDLCEARLDCVATISPSRTSVVNNTDPATAIATELTNLTRSTYVVVDSGWKYQYDKYGDRYIYVPLSADIAGCMARNDANRDPWISPAGSNKGRLLNVAKLAWNPNQTQRDALYKNGVNPVITQSGIGTVLFGDKTWTTRNTAFNRINVRRLFIEIEKTIGAASADVLFEQNDEITRSTFVNLVNPYLRGIQARRGITAFKVVCDASNNPEDAINRGEFVCDIFVQPTRSVNFIQLNFVAVRGSASFAELTA